MTITQRRYGMPELPTLRQAMDRLFDEAFIRPEEWFKVGGMIAPPIDAYGTKEAFVVKAALPGVKPEFVETTIEGDTLTISGRYEAKEEKEGVGYLFRELSRGEFRRSLVLPVGLRTEAAEATFEHGVLTLTIPKVEEAKPHKIAIKAA